MQQNSLRVFQTTTKGDERQVKGTGKFDLRNKLTGQVFPREQRFTFACADG
jgi:hypothetical protein